MTTGTRPPKPGPGYVWDKDLRMWLRGLFGETSQTEPVRGKTQPGIELPWWTAIAAAARREEKRKAQQPAETGFKVFDYTTGQFVNVSEEEYQKRQAYYEKYPEIAPPGTPEKVTLAEYDIGYQQDLAGLEPFKTPEGKFKVSEAVAAGVSKETLTRLFGAGDYVTPPGMQPIGKGEFGGEEFMPLTPPKQWIQKWTNEWGGEEYMPLAPETMALWEKETSEAKRRRLVLFDIMKDVLPDMTVSAGIPLEQAADVAVNNLITMINEQPDQFIATIQAKGWNPNTEALLLGVGFKWDDLKKIFPSVFEDEDIQNARKLVVESPEKFAELMQTGGRTKEKQDLLQNMGATWEQINEIFKRQKIVVPVDNIRKLVTVDTTSGRAYDDSGNWVGSWNQITKEFTAMPEEDKAKDVRDAFQLAMVQLGHQSKQFFASTLPKILYRDLTDVERKLYGDDWADQVNFNNKMIRDDFSRIASSANAENAEWITKHPELQPRPEWRKGATDDPSILKDPAYWAYEFASSAPFTLATMAVTIGVTAAAGPVAGVAAGIVMMTPSQAADMEQMMVQYGAPEDKAAQIGLAVGTLMSFIEVAGDLPMFKMIAPKLFGAFRKNITEGVARATISGLIKKGIKTVGMVEITETLEEVAQQALQNAALMTVNENQSLFEGLTDTAVRTAIATLPLAIAGASPQIKRAVDEGIAKLPPSIKKVLAEERGAIGKEVPKEPWQMTYREFFDIAGSEYTAGSRFGVPTKNRVPIDPETGFGIRGATPEERIRRAVIMKAISEGKPVPAEVLKELDLEAKAPPVAPEKVTPEVTKLEAALPEEVRGLTPDELIETRAEMGTLASYTDDISFRAFLGKDTKYWNEATYKKAKTGQTFKVYRAVPTGITEIHSGAWVTQSQEYAQMHLESVLRGEGHIIEGTAKASDLVAMSENEFFYAPPVAVPEGKVAPEKTIGELVSDEQYIKATVKRLEGKSTDEIASFYAKQIMEGDVKLEQIIKKYNLARLEDSRLIHKEFVKMAKEGLPVAPAKVTPVMAKTEIEKPTKFDWQKDVAKELDYLRGLTKTAPDDILQEQLKISQANARKLSRPSYWREHDNLIIKALKEEIQSREVAIPKAEPGMPKEMPVEIPTEAAKPPVAPPVKAETIPTEEAAPSPLLTVPEESTLPLPDNVTVSEDRVVRPPPPPEVPPPHEPPPTHAPQPAPIENNRLVMPDLQPSQQVVDMYSRPDFWRNVGNLPLVKKAVGLFNPAAVANDPARQAIILRAVLKDEAAQKAQAVISHVWELGTQDKVWGKTDDMGLLTKEPFGALPIDEIRTYPDKYASNMTAQQKEWIKRADEIERAKLDALKRNGIEINELSFEDGGKYAGRRVMGKFNDSGELIESGRIGIGGRVGAKMPFEKTRVFKDAFDGLSAGYRYMNSDEALYYNTLGAYYKIADKQMADWILTKVDWRTTAAPESLVLQAESARLRLRKAQQLLAALNRAVRGERVPDVTINSIASAYSDQADTLKNLIPELQKPSPETADTVRILDAEAKALISEAKVEYYQAVDKRARAREEALRVKYEEASIAHPAFQGKIFTGKVTQKVWDAGKVSDRIDWAKQAKLEKIENKKWQELTKEQQKSLSEIRDEAKEIADILRKGLQPQFIEALGAVNKVNAIGRFFMLAGDASPMAIQLQFLAFYRPKAYAKAWGGFVKALYDPEFQYRLYANNRDLINKHPTLILSGRGTEFTEFMGRGGLGQKLGVLAKPLVPFQKAFEGCLDVAGIELAKSLDHRCTNPQTTMEVDQFINEFRGLTSSARIGVSSTQRQVETALVLAPRYNRAIAGYLFDIVHGGVRGSLARMSLAQGFAGLAAMAVAVSIWLGEDDDKIWEHFDPTSPKFFTWDVMGVKVGLGGKVRSVIKMFGNMVRTGEVGQPALNFLRGNLSPGASTALDLITGRNYIGESTRDNVFNFSKIVGRNFMMIWTQNLLLEGGTLQDKAIIATAEFFGLRGYDISARKELKIKDLEELLGQQIGKTPLLTKKKPDIYDTRNIYSDVKKLLQYTPPEEILADKGYAGLGHLVTKIEQSEANKLPDIKLKDYNFDKAKGDTLSDYMLQWAERQRITDAGEKATYTRVKIVEDKEERTEFKGLAALNAHKVDYPNAERGNVTRRQRQLLLEYNAATNKKQFIKDNPDIEINPQTAWFKAHPKDNAEFAIFGQAKVLSQAAYDEAQRLIKELDIPDSAVGDFIPPKEVAKPYFEYNDAVEKFTASSMQAHLIRASNYPGLDNFMGKTNKDLKPPENSLAYYDLKVKNYDKDKEYAAFSDKDSPNYKDDTKKNADGFTERQLARMQFKASNKEWADNDAMAEAHSKGTFDKPTPDATVKLHLDFDRIAREKLGVQPEEKLYYIDNPDYHKWALENKLTTADSEKWNEPVLRIQVKPEYQKIDKTIEDIKALKLPDIPNKNDPNYKNGYQYRIEQLKATKEGIAFDEDADRIEAHTHNGAEFVEQWVEHGQISREFSGGSAESKVWLYDNRKVWQWALGKELLSDTGTTWNMPVLRIDVKWREKDAELQAIRDKYSPSQSKEQAVATKAFWAKPENREYRLADHRREGYKLGLRDEVALFTRTLDEKGFPIPVKTNIEMWVEFSELPGAGYYYQKRYQLENPRWVQAVNAAKKSKGQDEWQPIDPTKVPAVQYDEITKQYEDKFDEFEKADEKGKKNILAADPTFQQANLKRNAYKLLIGYEKYVPDYVEYYNKVDADIYMDNYEDDWYLMEHPEFYEKMRTALKWSPTRTFDKVPSRKVWAAYQVYDRLTTTLDRHRMRASNLDLDAWLYLKGYVKTKIETQADYEKLRARGGPSEVAAYKRFKEQEEFEKKGAEIDRIIQNLGRKLAGVR